jgi:hypothetical protein
MSVDLAATLSLRTQAVSAESLETTVVRDRQRLETVLTALATGVAVIAVSAIIVAVNLL